MFCYNFISSNDLQSDSGGEVTLRRLTSGWLKPPGVYADVDDSVRHATWLELFFDLVFVVAIAELGGYLHEHLTPVGFLHFAVLFAIVWWIWLDISYFSDTYDTDDPMSVAMMLAAMFGVIFLSQTVEGAFAGESLSFAIAVFVLRGFLTLSHLRARALRDDLGSGARTFLTAWIGLEVLVTIIWGLSLVVPEPGRFGLWGASFVLGVAGVTVIYVTFETIIAPTASHCNERLGLFTILVLGETVLAVATGLSIAAFTPTVLVVGGLSFSIAVSAWWLYFHRYDERVYDRTLLSRSVHWATRRPRGIAHVYAHLLVHAGIVLTGVGIAITLEGAFAHHALGASSRVAICLGLAAFLLGSGISHWMAPASLDGRAVAGRAAVIGFLGLLAAAGGALSPVTVVGLIALALAVLIAYEALTAPRAVPRPRPPDEALGDAIETP